MQDQETRALFHAMLDDRGVVCVRGIEAKTFLQNLVTNDVLTLGPGEARYAALLTPQGKIIVDFLATEAPAENGSLLYLDCPRSLASDVVKRLAVYRLRAKIDLEDASERLRICAAWGEAADAWHPNDAVASFRDPRTPSLGRRFVVSAISKPMEGGVDAAFYEAHRIALGVPKGGIDFAFGETFPHDANLDLLHGIDFNKGCYIGQEVVSRVEHRGTARKRIVRVRFAGAAPASGMEITAGEIAIGTMGSASDGVGLVMIRTDRAEEAIAAKVPLMAADIELTLAPAG